MRVGEPCTTVVGMVCIVEKRSMVEIDAPNTRLLEKGDVVVADNCIDVAASTASRIVNCPPPPPCCA